MTFRSLAAAALLLALAPSAGAQALKVGYIDTDQVVLRMPEFAQVQTQLRTQQQTVAQRVRVVQDSLNTLLQTRVEEYQAYDASALATDAARRERQAGIYQLQAQIEGAEQQGYQFLSYSEARLLQPVLARVDEAINQESTAQSLDLVLPTVANNAPVFLYVSDRLTNITEAVMRRLGVDPNAQPYQAPQPAGQTAAPGGN